MSKSSGEVEVKVFLDNAGKYASRSMIFSGTYRIDEIDKIPDDIRSFLHDYQDSIAIIVETADKSRAKGSIPPSESTAKVANQQTSIKQEHPEIKAPADNKPYSADTEENNELKFVSAGGCHDVEASAHLLTVDGHTLLLDAGYSEKSDIDLDLIREQKPEAIFVTHAHLDHVGSLPIVHRIFPTVPIYMTSATKLLSYKILEDSVRVASSKGNEPLFSKEEVANTLESVTSVEFDQEFDFQNLKAVFRCAGHILGASYIIIRGNRRVLYTGDISSSKSLTTSPAYIPTPKESVDLLISESTYGSASDVEPREIEVAKFCSKVSDVIERGGRVLIPSFALGRAQEVLTILLNKMNEGKLRNVPVIVDGMARDIVECYDYYSDYMPSRIYKDCRESNNLRLVTDKQDRKRIAQDNSPCVIIASSGMLAGGPSVAYAREILTEEKSAILIVGYVDEETPGRRLADSKLGEGVELVSEEGAIEHVKRRCEVREYNLSSHSNQTELVNFSTAYNPATVFLVHGEIQKKVPMAKTLLSLNIKPVFIPENHETIDVERLLILWSKIKVALTATDKTDEELNTACRKIVENLYGKGKNIRLEDLIGAIEDAELLGYCSYPRKVKDMLLFTLFEWGLKYAQRPEGLDFEFSASIVQNETLLLQTLFGKGFGRRFLYGLGPTLPRMFKNFIVGGGRKHTSNSFKVSIASKSQLLYSLDNFRKHFAPLGIIIPTVADVQRACQDHVKRFPRAEEKYVEIFGEPPIGGAPALEKPAFAKPITVNQDTKEPTDYPFKFGEEYTSRIKSMTETGAGIALVNGFSCHVLGAGLGELVKFRIKSIRANLCEADLVEVLQKSPKIQATADSMVQEATVPEGSKAVDAEVAPEIADTRLRCSGCNSLIEDEDFDTYDGLCKQCYFIKLQSEIAKNERRSGTVGADRAGTW